MQSNSPPLSRLIFWIKRNNIEKLQRIFPLKDQNTWIREKYKKYYSEINLSKMHEKIYSDFVDPLFIKKGINIRDESDPSKHREDNLFCSFEMALRELKKGQPVEQVLKKLRSECENIAPPAFKPLAWMLNPPEKRQETERSANLEAKWKELFEERNKINKRMGELADNSQFIKGWRRKTQEMEEVDKRWLAVKRREWMEFNRIETAINLIGRSLAYIKIARGKPGRHPKPFNTFVYHLINECTHRKLDENRRFMSHEDGRFKLERDWNLILYSLLDTHVKVISLPELEDFIEKNKKKSASEALKDLKKRLWDSYKNFPPLKGWAFARKTYETGFRKLIITDDDRLDIVML